MERIVTNLVKLNELKRKPCDEWLKYFDENGVADAHKAFIVENVYPYNWLYKNSNIDLIAWEIENNCFNWIEHSWAVAKYCPDKIDPDKYNWEKNGCYVAIYCPDKIDIEKFNWKDDSWVVAAYCPDKLDPEKFNWEKQSWAIVQYCPDKLDLEKFNWWKEELWFEVNERTYEI